MTNNIFTPDLELKEEFIQALESKFSDAITYVAKSLLLTKIESVEIELGKDFYNFTQDEIKNMLREFRAKSVGSLNTYWSILCKYLIFAYDKRDNVDLSIVKMLSSKDLESFVNKVAEKDRFITREELHQMLLRSINPQDQAIFVLLFEGVCGKDYEEILNLQMIDVDLETGTIRTPRKDIVIKDSKSLFIIEEAMMQQFYFVDNMMETVMAINPKNSYVIKKLACRVQGEVTDIRNINFKAGTGLEPITANRLKVKIQTLNKVLEKQHLTGKTIYNSGLAERFLQHFGYGVNPSEVSNETIKEFLQTEKENISPANLRVIAKSIQEKLGII